MHVDDGCLGSGQFLPFLFPALFAALLPLPSPPQSVFQNLLLLEFTLSALRLIHIISSPTQGKETKMERHLLQRQEIRGALSTTPTSLPSLTLSLLTSKMGKTVEAGINERTLISSNLVLRQTQEMSAAARPRGGGLRH